LLILKKYVLLHSLTTIELIDLFKLFNGVMTAKKAYEQTKLVKEETNKNRTLYSKADSLIKKIGIGRMNMLHSPETDICRAKSSSTSQKMTAHMIMLKSQ